MNCLLLFSILLSAANLASASNEATYMVLVPRLLRPGLDFVVSVQFQSRDRVKVVAQIKKDDIPFAYSTMDYTGQGQLRSLNIRIPNDASEGKYKLEFSAWRENEPNPMNVFMHGFGSRNPSEFGELNSPVKNNFVSVMNRTDLQFQDHTWSIFIQTDKPKYKPGDTVRFRVFAVLPNLRPYMGNMDVTIYDPKGNQMKKLKNHRGSAGYKSGVGMSSDTFELADLPTLGTWRIKAKIQGQEEQGSFVVEKYVLPKFDVSLVLPDFVSMTDDTVVLGKVKAKYTFGQGVDGRADVSIKYGWKQEISKNVDVVNGEGVFTVTVEDLKKISSRWGKNWFHETRFQVTANVTDGATGTHVLESDSFNAYNHKERVKFLGLPKVFKPGMKFLVRLKASLQDGSPIVDSSRPVNLTYYFKHKEMEPVLSTMAMLPPKDAPFDAESKWVDLVVPWGVRKLRLKDAGDGLVNVTWAQDKLVETEKVSILKTVPPNGMVEVEIDVPEDAHSLNFMALYGNQNEHYAVREYVGKAFSPSNSFIRISQVPDQIQSDGTSRKLKAGDVAKFTVSTTEFVPVINYLILGRGTILGSGEIKSMPVNGAANSVNQNQLQIHLNALMSPSSVILVYFARPDGEIVADSININIDGIFKNKVSIGFNKVAAQPGDGVNLLVKAAPNSLVGVVAVDKSVKLMGDGSNDITVDDVKEALDKFRGYNHYWSPFYCRYCDDIGGRWGPWPISSSADNAAAVFRNANIKVLTDGVVQFMKDDPIVPMYHHAAGVSSPGFGGVATDVNKEASFASDANGPGFGLRTSPKVKTRKEFPETWLWTEEVVAPNGETMLQAKVPDTMTTWIASAFALHPIEGLGVTSEDAELVVAKPFFVSLHLPYSIVRGEEVALHVIVFNNHETDSDTMVVLAGNSSFQNIVYNKLSGGGAPLVSYNNHNQIRRVRVPRKSATSVFFPIRATRAGVLTLQVMAQSNITADYVERLLLVEPEGLKKSYTIPAILTPSSSSSLSSSAPQPAIASKLIPISFPAEIIPDSARVEISVIGDVMGGAADQLENLVRLPTGCGEQNLVNLAPSVFILRYLKVTQRFAPTLTEKAVRFIKKGYQQELSYQRNDGSFSAWGSRDSAGSTWLTAFVIKTFSEALEFDSDIDPYVIGNATSWILRHQNESGTFNEPGLVYMRRLQGGGSKSSGSIALTAYITSALLEVLDLNALPKDAVHFEKIENFNQPPILTNKSLTEAVIDSVKKSMDYLRSKMNDVDDTYTLALLAYALNMEQDMFVINGNLIQAPPRTTEAAKNVMEKLELKAKDLEDGSRYWPVKEIFTSDWTPSSKSHKSSGPTIETAAYAILTYLRMDDVSMFAPERQEFEGLKKAYPVIQWLATQANELGGYKSTQDTVLALQALSYFSQRSFNSNLDLIVEARATADPNFFHTFVINNWNAVVLQSRELPVVPREVELVAKGNGSAAAKVSVTYHVPEEKDQKYFDVVVDYKPSLKGNSKLNVCAKTKEGTTGMTIFEIHFPSGFGMAPEFDWRRDLKTRPLNKATNVDVGNRKMAVYFDELDDRKSVCVFLELERKLSVAKVKPAPIKIYDYYNPDMKSVVMYGASNNDTLCDFLSNDIVGCAPPDQPWTPNAGSNNNNNNFGANNFAVNNNNNNNFENVDASVDVNDNGGANSEWSYPQG